MRKYTKEIYKHQVCSELDDEVYSIDDWNKMIQFKTVWNDCGSGYWAKDGLRSDDEVFHSEQLDATHVVWYSK